MDETCPNCDSDNIERLPRKFRPRGRRGPLYLDDEVTVATHQCAECREPLALEADR